MFAPCPDNYRKQLESGVNPIPPIHPFCSAFPLRCRALRETLRSFDGNCELRHRVLKWLSWSVIDAIWRLAVLTAGTTALSRLLSPHDFGVSALILTVVTVASASVTVGSPFEESLSQRKIVRMLIGLGIGIYAAFLAIFARQQFAGLAALRATRAKPAES